VLRRSRFRSTLLSRVRPKHYLATRRAFSQTFSFAGYWSALRRRKDKQLARKRELPVRRVSVFWFFFRPLISDCREYGRSRASTAPIALKLKEKRDRRREPSRLSAKKEAFLRAPYFSGYRGGWRLPLCITFICALGLTNRRGPVSRWCVLLGHPVSEPWGYEPSLPTTSVTILAAATSYWTTTMLAYRRPDVLSTRSALQGVRFGISTPIWAIPSPRRRGVHHTLPGTTHRCNCYAPGDSAHAWFLDVNKPPPRIPRPAPDCFTAETQERRI